MSLNVRREYGFWEFHSQWRLLDDQGLANIWHFNYKVLEGASSYMEHTGYATEVDESSQARVMRMALLFNQASNTASREHGEDAAPLAFVPNQTDAQEMEKLLEEPLQTAQAFAMA